MLVISAVAETTDGELILPVQRDNSTLLRSKTKRES